MADDLANDTILVRCGSGYRDTFTVVDDELTAIPIPDWTDLEFRVRRRLGKANAANNPKVISLTEDAGLDVDRDAGTVIFTITDEMNEPLEGQYYWEIWADEGDGAGQQFQGGGPYIVERRVEP